MACHISYTSKSKIVIYYLLLIMFCLLFINIIYYYHYQQFVIKFSSLIICCLLFIIYLTGDIAALIHRSLQGAPELTGGVTVSTGCPVFELMADGSEIFFPPKYKNKNNNYDCNANITKTNKGQNECENKNDNRNKFGDANNNENEDEMEYHIEYAGSRETDELLYPLFINEAAYNEKDIAFLLMLKIELDLQIIVL